MVFLLYRREVDSLLTVMLYDDSSSDDSSSDSSEDLDFLLVCALFPEPSPSAPRLNLDDLTDYQCETMFR